MAITSIDENSHQPKGIFHAGWSLLDSGELSDTEAEDLRSLLQWFNKHMPYPTEFELRTLSRRAIFWFRPDAQEYIKQSWDLVQLLRAHGLLVEVLKTDNPGSVAFADFCQVAAIPTKGTF